MGKTLRLIQVQIAISGRHLPFRVFLAGRLLTRKPLARPRSFRPLNRQRLINTPRAWLLIADRPGPKQCGLPAEDN